MGKNRHSKDKLYIVASEYQRDWGGYKKRNETLPFRCLPFYCCGLSLLPFDDAVCTDEGIVFDSVKILQYIKEHGRNPVTGKPLSVKDLIPLHFHKNADGEYHCPVTYKVFNDHSFIVANRKSGHVYLHDAIETLCRKAKNWKDLITGEPFVASDIVTIQNPHNVEGRQIEGFDYVKRGIPIEVEGVYEAGADKPAIQRTEMMERILKKVKTSDDASPSRTNDAAGAADAADPPVRPAGDEAQAKAARPRSSLYTTYEHAASFTSTVVAASAGSSSHGGGTQFREMTEMEMMEPIYAAVKKKNLKGYVRLVTSLGTLNLEIHANWAPMAADNFLRHCESGYYVGTIFHRCMANFMIQGGDPTGTGKGGKPAFEDKRPFKDEFYPKLTHTGPGIVAMANSGKNTNKSQFYITFKSCEHLNNKHTIFGRVVGGLAVLQKMEKLETYEKSDRPKEPPTIDETVVFKNPFTEVQTELAEAKTKSRVSAPASKSIHEILDPMREHPERDSKAVGKYLPKAATSSDKDPPPRPG